LEGYVLHTYGSEKYLRHAVASVHTLRRHDTERPVALYADAEQIQILKEKGLDSMFSVLEVLPEEHRSIVGFKHHLASFKPFQNSLFVDSDIVWCRNPDPLWRKLQAYSFTATGLEKADAWFGGPKGFGIILDRLLDRRRRTMRRFGITYLPRVQAGMIYADDLTTTEKITEKAREFLSRRKETHFRSRLAEGRNEESCEWSLAMAMSALDLPITHWFQGQDSPQMDYIEGYVEHDEDFRHVRCLYYTDAFIHGLRGLPNQGLRDSLVNLLSRLPGRGDYMWVTPYALHFGWMRHKQPFYDLSDQIWGELTQGGNGDGATSGIPHRLTSLDQVSKLS
jgi:hypothetical protein